MSAASDQLLNDLAQLADEAKAITRNAGRNLYSRLQKVASLLEDADWLRDEHRGAQLAALRSLELRFFPDLCGSFTVENLLTALKEVPRHEWEEQSWNLRNVTHAAFRRAADRRRAAEEASPQRKPAATEQVIRAKEQVIKATKERAEEAKEIVQEKECRIQRLEAEVMELRSENQKLRDKVRQLQSKLKSFKTTAQ